MDPFATVVEDAEHLCRAATQCPHGMGSSCVEFGGFAAFEREFAIAEVQPKSTTQHEEPFVPVVSLLNWGRCEDRVGDLVRVDRCVFGGEGDHHMATPAHHWSANSRIGLFCRQQVIDANAELASKWDE